MRTRAPQLRRLLLLLLSDSARPHRRSKRYALNTTARQALGHLEDVHAGRVLTRLHPAFYVSALRQTRGSTMMPNSLQVYRRMTTCRANTLPPRSRHRSMLDHQQTSADTATRPPVACPTPEALKRKQRHQPLFFQNLINLLCLHRNYTATDTNSTSHRGLTPQHQPLTHSAAPRQTLPFL